MMMRAEEEKGEATKKCGDDECVVGIVAWLSLARSLSGVTMQGSTPLPLRIGCLVRPA